MTRVQLLCLLWALSMGFVMVSANEANLIDMVKFRKCVTKCKEILANCFHSALPLLKNFKANSAKIMSKLSSCCLSGENDKNIGHQRSFATCARDKCEAKLWGCQFKMQHSGARSKGEFDFLRKENKKREMEHDDHDH